MGIKTRKIQKSHSTLTGMYLSVKDHLWKTFESPLERDFISIMEFDYTVDAFYEQPVTIEYIEDSKKHRYTPDFLVYFDKNKSLGKWLKPQLVEIKTQVDLKANLNKYEKRFSEARKYAENRNWEFKIFTEEHIRTPYLKNANFLRDYRDYPIQPRWEDLLITALISLEESTPKEVISEAYNLHLINPDILEKNKKEELEPELISTLWNMIEQGSVVTDLSLLLTMSSKIWYRIPSSPDPIKKPSFFDHYDKS